MPIWAWIVLVLGVLAAVVVGLAIWHYPDDNSF